MKNKKITGLKAVILDMDGVITQTARIHRAAWKEMFNSFMESLPQKYGRATDEDYKKFIDGKPRYDGVKSFLESRNIKIPYGSVNDPANKISVCGLGNKKNEIFLSLLKKKGVEPYNDAMKQIKRWKNSGLKTAVVSSSKNCKEIIHRANIEELFDTLVDGRISEEKGLKGKPEPDIFIEAAKALDVKPESCVLFEDAISGVQAGCKGNFALVVGVCRDGIKSPYFENGADIVVDNLEQIDLNDNSAIDPYFTRTVPLLYSNQPEVENLLHNKLPVLFLDFDGTLSPIVSHPEDAVLPEEIKHNLKECAARFNVAIVSGRDMDDLKEKVNLENLIFAGSHGFRISGPSGLYMEHPRSKEILPVLDQIEKTLSDDDLDNIKGIQIDRKRYAIAVHYRNVRTEDISRINDKVNEIIDAYPGFRKGKGKKILEIKPDLKWDKGKAVNWILEKLNLKDQDNILPIYIGDDVTDEDAFNELKKNGLGIIVGSPGTTTAASWGLKNPYQVGLFLKWITEIYNNSK